ncbi:MAG: ACT domain-containing protein [Desulfurococcaceae archaeon]|uniref:ACT domain-containing protein n=1 Tax=Staphylothermus marinus TaxID=2280 RepID=A0A7C4D6I1_STAMA
MRFREIIRVDSKGRITIPLPIREAMNIHEGMNILVVADLDEKKIFLSPIPDKAHLIELETRVVDKPGVIAGISSLLAEYGVDIIALKCVVIKRGELGECLFIVDLSKSTIVEPRDLENILLKLDFIKEIKINELKG